MSIRNLFNLVTGRRTQSFQIDSRSDGGIEIGVGGDKGWRDITGQIQVRGSGPTDPTWSVIDSGAFSAYDFAIGDKCWFYFHIPHDIVPGADILLHIHYLTDGVDTNTIKWQYTYDHVLGYQRDQLDTTGTVVTSELAGAGTAYTHHISETDPITIANLTEPDGIIAVQITRITNGATDNTDTVYVLTADVHYQSTNLATPERNAPYYT